jgi:group I intron endonuclease
MDLIMSGTSGIYRIVNTASGTTYIGSSMNMVARLARHKRMLERGIHFNAHLQNSWLKHGKDALVFEPLVSCEQARLAGREQEFIDAYTGHDLPLYNRMPSAKSRVGFLVSEETRAKMSKAKIGTANARGHKWSPEMYEKMRIIRGKQICSYETRAKMSAVRKGVPQGPRSPISMNHRAAISAFMMGRKNCLGHKLSLEHREKISASMKAYRMAQRTNQSEWV